jgi:DNA-binding beta-propeller fold protein YncE
MDRRQFLLAAAVAPYSVRAQLVRGPVALVTCDEEARLALVDLRTFRVVGHVATPPDPRAIETVGGVAVVCHTAAGLVTVVDRERVRRVVRGFVEPRYTAAHPDGVHAFVTDSGRSGVAVLDTRRGVVVHRVRLSGWARHLTISPDGGRLWIGLGSASEHVSVVSTRPFRHERDLTPGFLAHDVGFAPDGRLWVTSGASRALAVGATRHTADLAPQHVTFGNGRAFVTSGDSGTLHVQTHDGRILSRTTIPVGSYNVQFAHGRVVTPSLSRGTLTILDAVGRKLATVQVASSCHDACVLA